MKVVREGHEIKGVSKQADEEGEDFFIGGQDSCLGDSGGPMWKVLGSPTRRAFLVGVVSRGLNCANNDAPGIYARVKMYLGWIYANAKEGECPNLERQRKRKMREEKEEEEEEESDEDEDSSSAGESIEFSDEIGDDDEEEETSSILEERRLRLNLLLKENGGGGGDERTNNAQGVLDLLKKRREKESKKEVVRKHIDKIIETVAPDYGGGDYTEKKGGGGGGGKAGEDMGGGTHIISRETLRASTAKGGMGGGGEGRPHRQKVSKDSQERARLRRGEQEGGGSGDDLADYLDEDVGGKKHRKSRRRRHVAKARYDGMKAEKEGGSRLKAPSAKKRGRKSF